MKPFCKEYLLEYPPPPHCFAFLPYSWRGARDPSRACFIAGMQSEWHPNLRDQLSCINRSTLTPTPRRGHFSYQPMLPSSCSFDSQMTLVVLWHMLWVLATPTAWVLLAFFSYPLIIWNHIPAFENLESNRHPTERTQGALGTTYFLKT